MSQAEIIEKIKKLKKEKNAIILAHCYQRVEIDEVADFVGDSLGLSREAAKTDADIILFAGVSFMAETAKMLSPDKKVLLPRTESGCFMADMINLEDLKKFKAEHPGIPVVCYVNSSAEIKAHSDICCTSANAVKVVESLGVKEVLFIPDKGLGGYVHSQLPDVNVITFPGFCPTHMRIVPEDVDIMKEKYPNAPVLVHPECRMEVIEKADFVGSTTGIIKFAKESDAKQFIIVTEQGVVDRLNRDYPEKEFILISDKAVCQNMKWNTLEDILISLEREINEMHLDRELAEQAYIPIKKMLDIK
jgi:quinolinate synthase